MAKQPKNENKISFVNEAGSMRSSSPEELVEGVVDKEEADQVIDKKKGK